MSFLDEIIDEAKELAQLNVLPDYANHEQIARAVSEALHTYIAPHSTAANLAEASYNRIATVRISVDRVTA